jgi:ribosomal protein S18 acetylase RimI-like enzyme
MAVSRAPSPMPIRIRPASESDYDAVVVVWTASGLRVSPAGRESRENFIRQLQRFPDLYLVAEAAGRIVGVCLGSHDARKGWINRLAVLPECRRRGVASALVQACDQAIRRQDIEIVCALVEAQNAESCALFESLGFASDVPVRYYRKRSRPDA